MMAQNELFSVEEVAVTPRKETADGCNRCQHCFLLRRAFLEKQRNEALLNHCTHAPDQEINCIESVKE